MRNAQAAQLTITAMRDAGLLEKSDEALCEAVLGLAEAVDEEPANASLWREYRGAMSDLRGLTDGGSDAFEAAMAGLFASARNSENSGTAESVG